MFTTILHILQRNSILTKKSLRNNNFRKCSVPISVIDSWNKMQGEMDDQAKVNGYCLINLIKVTELLISSILLILCEFIIGKGNIISLETYFPHPYKCKQKTGYTGNSSSLALLSGKCPLRSTFHENSELINYHQNNTLDYMFMSLT